MSEELPTPASRTESYLAKAAGEDVTIPEKPESRIEQYLEAIAENGGGGGGGGTSNFNQLTNRPKYNGVTMTGSTNIPQVKTYTAGSNITINGDNEISATDTTYSAFTGTDGTAAGAAGLVPAPATADAGKFLKADGTWATAGGGSGPTVVQTTGTSTTDVMSQNATTSMVFNDPATCAEIKIGSGATLLAPTGAVAVGERSQARGASVAIGSIANAGSNMTVAAGYNASCAAQYSTVLGCNASDNSKVYSVALGYKAKPTRDGEVHVGTTQNGGGYNSTKYRVIGGVHDGQDAHDAVTVEQVNATIDAINTALSTSIPHIGATS